MTEIAEREPYATREGEGGGTRSRGTPRVTFLLDTPAKWNVFSVICVAGSPQDWAAMDPTWNDRGEVGMESIAGYDHTISPGLICAASNLSRISPSSQLRAWESRRYSFSTRLDGGRPVRPEGGTTGSPLGQQRMW